MPSIRHIQRHPFASLTGAIFLATASGYAAAADCLPGAVYGFGGTGGNTAAGVTYTCEVPIGVTNMQVVVVGAGGKGGITNGFPAQGGATVTATITVVPGATLSIMAGGDRFAGGVGRGGSGIDAGFGSSASGGSGSGIFNGNAALVIAGGGGGGAEGGGGGGGNGSAGTGGGGAGGISTAGADAVLNAGIAGFGGAGGVGAGGGGGGYGGGGGGYVGGAPVTGSGGNGGSYGPAGAVFGVSGSGAGAPGAAGRTSGNDGSVTLHFTMPASPAAIPTLGEWGSLALTALLSLVGAGFLRRRAEPQQRR